MVYRQRAMDKAYEHRKAKGTQKRTPLAWPYWKPAGYQLHAIARRAWARGTSSESASRDVVSVPSQDPRLAGLRRNGDASRSLSRRPAAGRSCIAGDTASGYPTRGSFEVSRILKREKPAGTDSDGPLDFVHGETGNGDDEHLDHSTSRPLRNPASLVSSNQTEIHNGNRTDQTRAI